MIDFDDNIESYENDSDYLDDLRKYSDSPRDYLYNYYEKYHKKRADFINGNFKDLGKFTSEFVYWFKEFLRLNWREIVKKMFDTKNLALCFFFAYLQSYGILEKEDFGSELFREYLNFLKNTDELKTLINKSPYKTNFKIYCCEDTLDDFTPIEKSDKEKKYCLISMPDDGIAAVRCLGKNYRFSDLEKNILILEEIEVKASLGDEFIYIGIN